MVEMEISRRNFAKGIAAGAAGAVALGMAGSAAKAQADEADATSEVQTPRKIAILIGAGQDTDLGNTSKLAAEFARGATEMGHEVTSFLIGQMDIKPCLGCGHCRQSEGRTCVWDDDMAQIYDAYWNSDMIVLATPMRYWTITGMLKNVIERFYRVPEGDVITGLPHDRHETYRTIDTALLVSSADTGWYTYNWLREWYQTLCNYLGWNDKGHLFVGGCGEYSWEAEAEQMRQGSTKHIEDTGGLEAAYEMGREIYGPALAYQQLVEASEWNMLA